jgi:hypothetical protein
MGAPKRSLSPRSPHAQKENPAKAKKVKAKAGPATDAEAALYLKMIFADFEAASEMMEKFRKRMSMIIYGL